MTCPFQVSCIVSFRHIFAYYINQNTNFHSHFISSADSSNDFYEKIKAKLDKATNLSLDRQQAETSDQGLIGSILDNLGIVLRTLLAQLVAGILSAVPALKDIIGGALKGASNGSKDGVVNGLIGAVGGLVGGITTGLQTAVAKAGSNGFKGEQSK